MSQETIEVFLQQPQEIGRLTDWIFATIHPFIVNRVIETNSAQGAMSSRLLESGFTVQLNATSENHREYLQETFGSTHLVRGIHRINFLNPRMEVKYLDFQERFSTVLALNIEEDFLYT